MLSQRMLLISAILSLAISAFGDGNAPLQYQNGLIKHLFGNNSYDKRIPPATYNATTGEHDPVIVSLHTILYRILGIDDRLETITAYFYITEIWHDPRLEWNPAEHGNISDISVRADEIWMTDTRVSSVAIQNQVDVTDRTHVAVNYTGHVEISYPAIMQEVCGLKLQYYPFDFQECAFYLNSKSSQGSILKYSVEITKQCTVINEVFSTNDQGVWTLDDCLIMLYDEKYVSKNYSSVYIMLRVSRHYLYHIVNLLAPAVAISILTTAGLFMGSSTDSTALETSSLGLTSLLSICVLLLAASDQIPKGASSISLLGIFYLAVILQNIVATLTSMAMRDKSWSSAISNLIRIQFPPKHCTSKTRIKEIRKDQAICNCSIAMACMMLHIVIIFVITSTILCIGLEYRKIASNEPLTV